MAGVLPKAKLFLFLGFIVLLINICLGVVAMSYQQVTWENYYNNKQDYTYTGSLPDVGENITIGNFAIAGSTSFLPYFSILSFPSEALNFDTTVAVFLTFILGTIGTIQLFLLIIIALNFAPKFLGSGFDV